ncbi:MAG: chlorite dismutase family protein [Acidimicrobiales bacterium]
MTDPAPQADRETTSSQSPNPSPSQGLAVLHLFLRSSPLADRSEALAAFDLAKDAETQVVTVAMLGHKADLAVMGLNNDVWALRRLQTDLISAGLELVDSYLSITELSEYAAGLPDQMKSDRLHPRLPPEGKEAWCFYPMSKRRSPGQNWYTTPFDRRKELMHEHGTSGRKFAGRLVQLITGSTGLDDYEWGVTLFAQHLDDLKEVVYTMRFDEASAEFAEFGPFYTGMVADPEAALTAVGLT